MTLCDGVSLSIKFTLLSARILSKTAHFIAPGAQQSRSYESVHWVAAWTKFSAHALAMFFDATIDAADVPPVREGETVAHLTRKHVVDAASEASTKTLSRKNPLPKA